MTFRLLILASFLTFAAPAFSKERGAELIMFDSTDCEWCEVWEEDIGDGYHKTSEAKKAPLRRVDIEDQKQVKGLKRRVNYTPTFVLFEDGQEVGRITGYPGPDFFYPLLGNLIAKLQQPAS